MKINHEITLDVARHGVQATIPLTQHEAGVHRLIFDLYNGSVPIEFGDRDRAVLYVDGDIYDSCIVYTENGVYPNCIVCDLSAIVTRDVGEKGAVLQIYKDSDSIAYSPEICFVIREDKTNGSKVLNSPQYSAVVKAQLAAEQYALLAEQYAEAAGDASPHIRINSITGNWEISRDGGETWVDTGMKSTGVHIGSDEPTEPGVDVWLDPNGNDVLDIEKELSQRANALVGNVSGEMVAMDDVSPLEHKIPVKVRSKNLIPYPFSRSTATINGMTFTDNGDGTITVNGTATDNAVYYFCHYIGKPIAIPKGVYTLSGVPVGGASGGYSLGLRLYNDGVLKEVGVYEYNRTDEMDSFDSVYIYVKKGSTANNVTFKPQLEPGATATTHTPYVADDEVITVKSCGKNLIPYPYADGMSKTSGGVTFTVNDDRSITVNGTTTADAFFSLQRNVDYGENIDAVWSEKATNGKYAINRGLLYSKGGYYNGHLTLYLPKGSSYDNEVYYPQIELGTVTTENEPYKEGETITTTLAEGAELTSIAPNMTIYTDKAGAIVECSYNKDTNIVIEKLTQAIISLGGNI